MREECATGLSWSTGRKASIRSVAAWKRPRQERLQGYHIDYLTPEAWSDFSQTGKRSYLYLSGDLIYVDVFRERAFG
jgi:hypothetical protein